MELCIWICINAILLLMFCSIFYILVNLVDYFFLVKPTLGEAVSRKKKKKILVKHFSDNIPIMNCVLTNWLWHITWDGCKALKI